WGRLGPKLQGPKSQRRQATTPATPALVANNRPTIGRINPQVPQNLPGYGVLAGIFWEALFQVSVNGIKARVLQAVSLKLRQEPDTAAFVSTQVNDDAASGFLDFLHRFVQLLSAVATSRMEYITSQALRVHTY